MAIEKKNAWEKYPQGPEREKLFAFAEDYRRFISGCKTERECVTSFVEKAEKVQLQVQEFIMLIWIKRNLLMKGLH